MNKLSYEKILIVLQKEINSACIAEDTVHNDWGVFIPDMQLRQAVRVIMEKFGITHLSTILGQQRQEKPDEISIKYFFWKGNSFSLHVNLMASRPELDTIIDLIPGADFYEREIAEMFGVKFTGRAKTTPLLLPENWMKDPPMLIKNVEDKNG